MPRSRGPLALESSSQLDLVGHGHILLGGVRLPDDEADDGFVTGSDE
jgi:hypothetical protein